MMMMINNASIPAARKHAAHEPPAPALGVRSPFAARAGSPASSSGCRTPQCAPQRPHVARGAAQQP